MIKSVGVVVVLGSSRTDQAGCQRKHRVVLLLTPPIIHLQHHGRCTLKHQVLSCDVLVPQVQFTFYIVEVWFPWVSVQCTVYRAKLACCGTSKVPLGSVHSRGKVWGWVSVHCTSVAV